MGHKTDRIIRTRDRQDWQVRDERQDRQIWHLNLIFQVTCVRQLSQFLRCFHLFRHQRFADDDGNDDDNFSKDANAGEITIILLNMLSTIGRRSDSTFYFRKAETASPPLPVCRFSFANSFLRNRRAVLLSFLYLDLLWNTAGSGNPIYDRPKCLDDFYG